MSNCVIANFINILNVSSRNHLKSIHVDKHHLILPILDILYKNGIIFNFRFDKNLNKILVFLKYNQNRYHSFNIELVSKPSKRVFFSLRFLSLNSNKNSFSSFYIILHQKVY